MRLILLVAAVLAVIAGKPAVPNSEHRELLAKYFGEDFNLRVVNRIIAEEAHALGISARQHFKHCILDDEKVEIGETIDVASQLKSGRAEFERMLPHFRFKSVGMAMRVLKHKTPTFYAALNGVYKERISELGEEASLYLVHLKFTLLEALVNYVNASGKEEIADVYVHAIKQLYAEYGALSTAAKADFERNTCIYTLMRISDSTGKKKGQISKAKQFFDKVAVEY